MRPNLNELKIGTNYFFVSNYTTHDKDMIVDPVLYTLINSKYDSNRVLIVEHRNESTGTFHIPEEHLKYYCYKGRFVQEYVEVPSLENKMLGRARRLLVSFQKHTPEKLYGIIYESNL